MQLLFLLLVLIVPSPILSVVERYIPGFRLTEHIRRRIALSLFFGVTSSGHFVQTSAMAEMVPPFVPFRRALIYVTGVLQIFGIVGLWLPRLERLTGVSLMLMMLGLLPANIYAAFKRVQFGGHAFGPIYLLVRVPFQALVAWRIYITSVRRQP